MTHLFKYIVVKNLGQGRANVVIFVFLLYVFIFYTSCIIAAALKTDA